MARNRQHQTSAAPEPAVADWMMLAGVCTVIVLRVFSDMSLALPTAIVCEGAMIVLAGAYVCVGVGRGRLAGPALKLLLPVGAFTLVMFVSALRAAHRYAAWGAFLHFVSCLLVFVLLVGLAGTVARRRFVVAVLMGTIAIAAGLGIDQYFVGIDKTQEMKDADSARALPKDLAVNLRGRFHDRRAFGPFDVPNALAGFVTLMFPLAMVGLLVRVRRKADHLSKAVLALLLIALVAALILSFSKAGWLVFAGVMCASVLWLVRDKMARRTVLAVVVAAVLLVTLGGPGLLGLHRYLWSASARVGYWQAGAGMIAEGPVLGVGIGNFAEHFFRHRTITGEETRFAHNDYLQIAAETGVLGLAAFAALLASWFWLSRPRPEGAVDDGDAPPFGAGLLVATGVVAFLLLARPAGALHPLLLVPIVPGWLLVAVAGWQDPSEADDKRENVLLSAAALFGAIGVLVHCLVDFHLYSRGLSFPLWAVMALATGRGGVRTYPLGTVPRRATALTGLCLVLVVCWPPCLRALRCESLLLQAEAAQTRQDWPGYMQKVIAAAEAAPQNPVPRAKLGLFMQAGARQIDDKTERLRVWRDAARHLRQAAKLRPTWAAYQVWLADLYEESSGGDERLLSAALSAAEHAVELYPNQTHYRVDLGRLYERLGEQDDAVVHYGIALDIDAAVRDADGPASMRLSESVRSELLDKTVPP